MKKLLFLIGFFLPGLLVPAETPINAPSLRYRVALTFDDGPRPEGTPALEETLARHNVRATFFVVGQMACQYPDLVRSLFLAGHELAGHSWSHGNIRRMSAAVLRKELDMTRGALRDVTGRNHWLFRPPGGTERYFHTKFVCPRPYELVLWDVHSLDQEGLSAEEIADRVERQVKNGDIVLLHNNLRSTREALDIFVPHLKARGFEFVTVSEIYAERGRLARADLR